MATFIDEHRDAYGAEPICTVWPIAPSTYYSHKARQADPERRGARSRRDDALRPRIRQACEDNFAVYGVHRMVGRQFADLTCVATWRGFVYVAFVIDVFVRRIVGWRASSSLRSELVLEALDQALYDRPVYESARLIQHSDRGAQCLSMRYTEPGGGRHRTVGRERWRFL